LEVGFSISLSSIIDLQVLALLPIPPMILAFFEGKERGDLDLHFHQSLSPLCEGNLLDLDLEVLCGFPLVLPLISLHSICCFGRISERRI
jgi:hypothetical protein